MAHHLIPIGSGDRVDDDEGESFVRFRVCRIGYDGLEAEPTDEQIDELVREEFPSYRCQHSYDCCGNFYPAGATWSRVKTWGSQLEIIVRQCYSANI
jgi:hypothetical protein